MSKTRPRYFAKDLTMPTQRSRFAEIMQKALIMLMRIKCSVKHTGVQSSLQVKHFGQAFSPGVEQMFIVQQVCKFNNKRRLMKHRNKTRTTFSRSVSIKAGHPEPLSSLPAVFYHSSSPLRDFHRLKTVSLRPLRTFRLFIVEVKLCLK